MAGPKATEEDGRAAAIGRPRTGRVEGAKRPDILRAATERFGRDEYDTKWADIARDVGVGPTALYHYFESKQHCLFVIMDEAIASVRKRFDEIVAANTDSREALQGVLADTFDLTDHEVLRNRVLVSEQGLLSTPRRSPREEDARQAARARISDLEFAWATFLARLMQQNIVPERDPVLLTRAVLGFYNGVWHWYRPNGTLALEDVRDFFVERGLAMLGVQDPALAS